jgi:hypothetical protein
VGRNNLIEMYRSYQATFFRDRCFDLRTHRSDDSTVTLDYASEGKAVATGQPYGNQYISGSRSRIGGSYWRSEARRPKAANMSA